MIAFHCILFKLFEIWCKVFTYFIPIGIVTAFGVTFVLAVWGLKVDIAGCGLNVVGVVVFAGFATSGLIVNIVWAGVRVEVVGLGINVDLAGCGRKVNVVSWGLNVEGEKLTGTEDNELSYCVKIKVIIEHRKWQLF